ncbi:MAG: hypothetical protein C0617_01695 [Desulfuromonas sp.]|uniref:hypothetical protein n=1 Tax=Desulfuromonas sp. TaxID=892 RepID=UPI000CA813C6|nr:hypothetical protein [Desulfuromonas sp.]PLX86316.1 MAG: hypothetical protein C0617_01695 [Desulfuromonas sp.]
MVKNKLRRLAEIIQEDFPEKLVDAFRSNEKPSLAKRLALIGEAIAFHQGRSEALWLRAGKKRSPEERRAAAQAELAAFVFAYLTGDAKEYADSAMEALRILGRHGDVDLVISLSRR